MNRALLLALILGLVFQNQVSALVPSGASATDSQHFRRNAHEDAQPRQGYTGAPKTRGTLDILWNCLTTLALVSWSSLCLNVPRPHAGKRNIIFVKTLLTGLFLLAPELTFVSAIGQLLAALKTRRLMKGSGKEWGLTECFYAEMGGFIVKPIDGSRSFPVDGRLLIAQIMYDV